MVGTEKEAARGPNYQTLRSLDYAALLEVAGSGEADPEAMCVAELVATEYGVPLGMLFKPSRGVAPVAFTRQIAMYLTHVVLGRPLTAIGEFYGRDRTTVSHACGLVEDLRDHPDFEERMCRLEDCISALRDNADWMSVLRDWSHAAS